MNLFVSAEPFNIGASSSADVQVNWYLFLLIMMLAAIAVCLIILMLSKDPKDWRHHSLLSDDTQKSNLQTLAESIKMLPLSTEGYAPVHGLLKRLFYDKICTMNRLSEQDIKRLYQNDASLLHKYVPDVELVNWLLYKKQGNQNRGGGSLFGKDKRDKQNQQQELIRIVEKMEKWGT
jgi:hypothetical protein